MHKIADLNITLYNNQNRYSDKHNLSNQWHIKAMPNTQMLNTFKEETKEKATFHL